MGLLKIINSMCYCYFFDRLRGAGGTDEVPLRSRGFSSVEQGLLKASPSAARKKTIFFVQYKSTKVSPQQSLNIP